MTRIPSYRERGDAHQRSGRYWRSVAAYLAALARREANRPYLTQQMGVSGVQTRFLLPVVPVLYAIAYAQAYSDDDRGNIRRDQARLLSKLGFRNRGERYINESLALLAYSSNRTAYNVSMGYAGLIIADGGFLEEGYMKLAVADEALKAGPDRQLEFNVKLHLIDVLLRMLRASPSASYYLKLTDQALREADNLTRKGVGATQQIDRLHGYHKTFDAIAK